MNLLRSICCLFAGRCAVEEPKTKGTVRGEPPFSEADLGQTRSGIREDRQRADEPYGRPGDAKKKGDQCFPSLPIGGPKVLGPASSQLSTSRLT